MEESSLNDIAVKAAVKRIRDLLEQSSAHYKTAFEVSESITVYNTKQSLRDIHFQLEMLKSTYLDIVRMLVNYLDNKDDYTRCHCERVTTYAVLIGQAMRLEQEDILDLEFAGLLHDIGKLAVPNEIINKEGILTEQEYELIKRHPSIGYELLKDISFLDSSKAILLQHHERIDGKGYPMGLSNGEINIKSKILAVADAYDAMISSRPYRKDGLSRDQAISQLELHKGSQFDDKIVDIFIMLLKTGEAA